MYSVTSLLCTCLWVQTVCLCVCLYLLVHMDPADCGRCCGFPSVVEVEGGLSWGCGLGSHSSDHRQFALWPRPGRSLWARSEGALSLRPHTHQTWQVNDGVSRLSEEPRVQSLNEGTHHNTTANKQGNTPPPPHFYFYMIIKSQLHVCVVIRDVWVFLEPQGGPVYRDCDFNWVFLFWETFYFYSTFLWILESARMIIHFSAMVISVGPPLWSRLEYFNADWTDCDEMLYRHSWCPDDKSYWLWWSSDFSSRATMRLTFVVLSEIPQQWMDCEECGSDIHVPLRMNCSDFGDPLTLNLAPSSGQSCDVEYIILTTDVWKCLLSKQFDKGTSLPDVDKGVPQGSMMFVSNFGWKYWE